MNNNKYIKYVFQSNGQSYFKKVTLNPSKYLRFILIHCVTNTENSSKEEIDNFFQKKKIFGKKHYAQYKRV